MTERLPLNAEVFPIVRLPDPVFERFENPERLEFTMRVEPAPSVRSWFRMRLEIVEFPFIEPLSIRMVALVRFELRIKFPESTARVPLKVWFVLDELKTRFPFPVLLSIPPPDNVEFAPKTMSPLEEFIVAFSDTATTARPRKADCWPVMLRSDPDWFCNVPFPEMFNVLVDVDEEFPEPTLMLEAVKFPPDMV